ncbi:hypothetical protein KO500_04470 [Cellulophaga baltica]|uniref:hypothetical protein n=1 Tax=Cellulophaga TaxID=104264 RepID=UPI001C069041|nr:MULTISPECIES: hypothetical protein [Cellulophaga]MBU2995671.1 hypothetical protein [Cellulophaga baltica]MDO6767065.1 hypothetical protein [Cellulophaga sp. 1_MG-2023]
MISKKSYIICILILSVFIGMAQEKSTTYYDEYWNETTKGDATYYRKRPLEKKQYQYSEPTTIYDRDETSINYDEELKLDPPIKSVYKNGKIFDGIEFDFSKHNFSKKTLKNGITQSLSLYVFAMHYANAIKIIATDTGYTVTETIHPKIKITAKNGTISFTYDDKIFRSKIKNELANLTIIYSIKNDTIIPIKKWNEDLLYTQKYLETYKSDFLGQYYTKLGPSDYSAANAFLKLKEQNNNEDFEAISSITYDSEGLPYHGMLIENFKTKYQGTIYKERVKGKTLKNATLKDLNEFYEKNY